MTYTVINKMVDIANDMIDERISMYGMDNTIAYLFDRDLSENNLMELGFDNEDIKRTVQEEVLSVWKDGMTVEECIEILCWKSISLDYAKDCMNGII